MKDKFATRPMKQGLLLFGEQQNEIEWIRSKLTKAEKSGFIDKTPEQILAGFKKEARHKGDI